MNVWKLVTGVVLVLLVGILVGSIGTWFLIRHPRPPWPGDHRSRTTEAVDRLSRELDLTKDQRAAVETIFTRMSSRLHEHFLQQRPEIDRIINDSFTEIKKELREDQKKKLDKVREKFMKQRGGPPPGPPPGPEPPP